MCNTVVCITMGTLLRRTNDAVTRRKFFYHQSCSRRSLLQSEHIYFVLCVLPFLETFLQPIFLILIEDEMQFGRLGCYLFCNLMHSKAFFWYLKWTNIVTQKLYIYFNRKLSIGFPSHDGLLNFDNIIARYDITTMLYMDFRRSKIFEHIVEYVGTK